MAQPATQPGTPPPAGNTSSGSNTLSIGTATKKAEAGSLEEMLDKALRDNPDIRAAEARVQDAEAECNRVRQQIIAKIVGLRNDIELAQKMLQTAQAMERFVRPPNSTKADTLTAVATVEKQKAEVTRLEADLKAVLGSYAQVKGGSSGSATLSGSVTGSGSYIDLKGARLTLSGSTLNFDLVQTPMAERIMAALEKPVKLDSVKEAFCFSVLDTLMKKAGDDVPFRILGNLSNTTISFSAGEMPLSAWLDLIEDFTEVRFVVRDYGILATLKGRVADGALSIHEFRKLQEKKRAEKAKDPPMTYPVVPFPIPSSPPEFLEKAKDPPMTNPGVPFPKKKLPE
jgi:hypothetical protein